MRPQSFLRLYRPHFSGFEVNIELSDLMAVIYIASRELSN